MSVFKPPSFIEYRVADDSWAYIRCQECHDYSEVIEDQHFALTFHGYRTDIPRAMFKSRSDDEEQGDIGFEKRSRTLIAATQH
jgi:hypothetical protein